MVSSHAEDMGVQPFVFLKKEHFLIYIVSLLDSMISQSVDRKSFCVMYIKPKRFLGNCKDISFVSKLEMYFYIFCFFILF